MFPVLVPGAELKVRCVTEILGLVTKSISLWDSFHCPLQHPPPIPKTGQNQDKAGGDGHGSSFSSAYRKVEAVDLPLGISRSMWPPLPGGGCWGCQPGTGSASPQRGQAR